MSGKLSEYVMTGCSVCFRVVAFSAGIATVFGGDSLAVAPYIAAASAVCAFAVQVIQGCLVKKLERLTVVEGQLLGAGTGFFICSALAVNPVASIGGTVCVGLSLVLTVLRGVLGYCRKDVREVEVELEHVLSDPSLDKQRKGAVISILLKIEEDLVRAENRLLDFVFNTINIRGRLKDLGFIALVDELNSLIENLRSHVIDPVDRRELYTIEDLLKLGCGGEILRRMDKVSADAELLKQEYLGMQCLVEQLLEADNRREVSRLAKDLQRKADSILGACFNLREEARGLLGLIKDPAVVADLVKKVQDARDLVAKLMVDSDVGGRAPNPQLYNELQKFDVLLANYERMLQDFHNNKLLEDIIRPMLEDARGMYAYAKSAKDLADAIYV